MALTEKRKVISSKASDLPHDYLKMVCDVFTSHFDESLKLYNTFQPNSYFDALGDIYSDEIVIAVSLTTEGKLPSTTVFASADFDPKASSPTMQDLLSACVDAIAAIFEPLLSSSKLADLELLANDSLAALDKIPVRWTEVESNQKRVYVMMDKSNLRVDAITDAWLKQNDPDYLERQERERKDTEALFFTGPKRPGDSSNNGGSIH